MDETKPKKEKRPLTGVTDVFRAIPRRGLEEEDIRKFGIDVVMDKESSAGHRYPFFRNGIHVANQVRRREAKGFYWEGDNTDVELFGQHLFPAGCADQITIVEGCIDAPSGWKLLGRRYPVVAVQSADSALGECTTNFEYLNSFKQIVLCLDKDEPKTRKDGTVFFPGQDAARKVAELFAPGKCRVLTLQHGKDPSDYLQQGIDRKIFVGEWWKAPEYRPENLKKGSEMLDEIINRPNHFAIPWPWEGLNEKTYGIRLSELVLVMADTGVGKTSVLSEMEHSILTNPDVLDRGFGVGFLHLEEPNHDTALKLLSIENNKPYHLPDTEKPAGELEEAFHKVLSNDRAIFYDHFGSNEIDDIVNKVRHMVVMGCKYIFIDHLSIIVSDQRGDERKQLDEISTKLKTLTMELNIAVVCVIHTNRNGEARGSAGPEKVANIHLSLWRDKKEPDPWRRNVTEVMVEKNRFSGRTGPACHLFYDEFTGRLSEMNKDAVLKYQEGGKLNDTDFDF